MPRSIKITASKGDVFGRLTVLKPLRRRSSNGGLRALVRCQCGTVKAVAIAGMRRGTTVSCGCYNRERSAAMGRATRKHGMRRHPLYDTWNGMIRRCRDPWRKEYPAYGGRGIRVCPEWLEDPRAFIAYAEQLPHYGESGRSIDRIDNGGHYQPGNIRWATASEQNRNRRDVLTRETAAAIKRLYASTGHLARYTPARWTHQRLAARFGVCRQTVSGVLNNRHWATRP